MNIYEVAENYREVIEAVEAGEVDERLIQDTLDSLGEHIEQFIENLSKEYKNKLTFAAALKEEAAKLKMKQKQAEQEAENIVNFTDSIMKASGLKKVQVGVHTVNYRKGSEVVKIDVERLPTPEEAPNIYNKVPTTFNLIGKDDLKKLIKAGEKIKGVQVVRNPDALKIK